MRRENSLADEVSVTRNMKSNQLECVKVTLMCYT